MIEHSGRYPYDKTVFGIGYLGAGKHKMQYPDTKTNTRTYMSWPLEHFLIPLGRPRLFGLFTNNILILCGTKIQLSGE